MRAIFKAILLLVATTVIMLSAPVSASAQLYNPFSDVCNSKVSPDVGSSSVCQTPSGGTPISGTGSILLKAVTILDLVIGVAAVIMIIVGGLRYVLSQGDPNNTNSSKNTILYAVIGLVVAASAQILVTFILNRL